MIASVQNNVLLKKLSHAVQKGRMAKELAARTQFRIPPINIKTCAHGEKRWRRAVVQMSSLETNLDAPVACSHLCFKTTGYQAKGRSFEIERDQRRDRQLKAQR